MLHYASLEQWSLGVNTVDTAITTPAGGFVMEMLLTMLLVLVVFASAVDSGNNSSPMLPPLLIGLTVTVAHLLLIPFTGELAMAITMSLSSHRVLRNKYKPSQELWAGSDQEPMGASLGVLGGATSGRSPRWRLIQIGLLQQKG